MAWLILCLCCSDFGFPCVLRLMRSRVASSNSRHFLLCCWLLMSISGVFLPAPLLINTARIEKVAGLVNFFAEFFYYENLYVRQELRAIMPTSKFKSRGGKHAANLENIGRESWGYRQIIAAAPYINWDNNFARNIPYIKRVRCMSYQSMNSNTAMNPSIMVR